MTIPIVSVVGKSDSGKTFLICGLVPELKRRGYRVATIKHDVHGFNIDHPGKDSWKHGQAGADTVVISSPQQVAMIEKVAQELTLDQVIARITNVDIIISEGYKRNDKPKLEVFRSTVHDSPLCDSGDNLLAIASDVRPELGVPVFALDDFAGMADLIENKILLAGSEFNAGSG
jgi:molybdopterin-guanine dinucleotide biosynthesis protein MobB